MRNTITRSFNKNNCSCVVYKDGKTSVVNVLIPYGFNNDIMAEKYIRKNIELDGKLAAVINIEKVSALYGMEENDFIQIAKLVTERSKETRNCITKTVTGLRGTLVYMDAQHKIGTTTVMLNKNDNIDKMARKLAPAGCKGITIEDISEVSELYSMTEADFIANAKPMKDYQHYIDE